MMWDLHDLRRGISIEQQHAREPIIFRVEAVRTTRGLVRLQVIKKPGRTSATLDESLEDARAWWPEKDGAPGGVGLVKMANPDDSEIVIKPMDGATIAPGQDVWVPW